MPAADVNPEVQASSKEEAPAVEIFLADADDQSGPVDADIAHLAEQRAMHSLLRYQTQAVKFYTHTSTNSGNATAMLPPGVPPVSHMQICHSKSVFMRATSLFTNWTGK